LQELALRALPAASWCFIHRIFATRSGFFVDVDIFLLSRKAAPTEIRLLIENEKRRTALQNLAADLSRRALFVTGQL